MGRFEAGLQKPLARIELNLAGEDPHQGRLSRAIAPHQRRAGTGLKRQIDTVKQGRRTVLQTGFA